MYKNIYWAWAIKNSICVICWIALAMVFDRWWIALFSLLFISSIEMSPKTYYCRSCDKCGEHSEYAETPEKALEKATKAGWVHYEDENKDYCPKCQRGE